MIEYDGYLDRSRLSPQLFSEGSLYSKRFFSDFERIILKNTKENTNTLAVNYQFTHEYKKVEFIDEMNNSTFGDVLEFINEEQTVSDLNRFIEQENTLIFHQTQKNWKAQSYHIL